MVLYNGYGFSRAFLQLESVSFWMVTREYTFFFLYLKPTGHYLFIITEIAHNQQTMVVTCFILRLVNQVENLRKRYFLFMFWWWGKSVKYVLGEKGQTFVSSGHSKRVYHLRNSFFLLYACSQKGSLVSALVTILN